MRIVSFMSLTLSILILIGSSSFAHPWTSSDLDIKEQGSSSYRIRGVIKSSTKYDYHGFIVIVRQGDENGPVVRNIQNSCSGVNQCGTTAYSTSVYVPQSKHHAYSQHCAVDGSHQLHPNDGFAQYVGNVCAGKQIDLNSVQLH